MLDELAAGDPSFGSAIIGSSTGHSPFRVLTAKNLKEILYRMKINMAFPEYYSSIPIVGIN